MKMYKMSSKIFNEIFAPRATPFNLCKPVRFEIRNVHSVYNSTEPLYYLGPKTRPIVPHELRQAKSLSDLK